MEMIVNALIESGVQVLAALAVALIGVAGTWITVQIGKVKQLQTVQIATDEAKDAAITTVLELQQTVVDDLKAAAVDGKLTKEEIARGTLKRGRRNNRRKSVSNLVSKMRF